MNSFGMIVTIVTLVSFKVTLIAAKGCDYCGKYQFCRSGGNGCGNCTDICESKKPDYNWELCQEHCYAYLQRTKVRFTKFSFQGEDEGKHEMGPHPPPPPPPPVQLPQPLPPPPPDSDTYYLRDHTLHYGSIMEHKDTIEKIYSLVIVIIILLITLVAMVGGVMFHKFYRYYVERRIKKLEQKKFQEKLSAVQYSISNNNTIRERETNGQGLSNMRNTMPSTITLTTQPESSPTYTNTSATRTLPLSSEEPSEDTTLDYASYVNQGMSHSQSRETDLNTTPMYRR